MPFPPLPPASQVTPPFPTLRWPPPHRTPKRSWPSRCPIRDTHVSARSLRIAGEKFNRDVLFAFVHTVYFLGNRLRGAEPFPLPPGPGVQNIDQLLFDFQFYSFFSARAGYVLTTNEGGSYLMSLRPGLSLSSFTPTRMISSLIITVRYRI